MTPHYSDDHLVIWLGDVRAALEAMEPESVDAIVTSPPYYSLRDYGLPPVVWGGELEHDHAWGPAIIAPNEGWHGKDRWNHRVNGDGLEYEIVDDRKRPGQGAFCPCGAWCGQLGLEPDPFLYIEHLVEVFRLARRVLRRDGTLWLNLGDSYASKTRGSDAGWDKSRLTNPGYSQKAQAASMRRTGERHRGKSVGFKNKDRMLIPARAAIALQEDGWWLRDEIVWAKPNPMPSSVEDRSTPAHEMVYLLTRSARYHYDGAAIRERLVSSASDLRKMIEGKDRIGGRVLELDDKLNAASGLTRVGRKRSVGNAAAAAATLKLRQNAHLHASLESAKGAGRPQLARAEELALAAGLTAAHIDAIRAVGISDVGKARETQHGTGRNGAAVQALADEAKEALGGYYREFLTPESRGLGRNKRSVWTVATEPYPEAHFATFPEKLIEPMILAGVPAGGVVLDPFGGSGTVAVVAQRLGRRAILVDLSEEYIAQAIRRVAGARGAGEGPAVDMPVPFADDGLWAASS